MGFLAMTLTKNKESQRRKAMSIGKGKESLYGIGMRNERYEMGVGKEMIEV